MALRLPRGLSRLAAVGGRTSLVIRRRAFRSPPLQATARADMAGVVEALFAAARSGGGGSTADEDVIKAAKTGDAAAIAAAVRTGGDKVNLDSNAGFDGNTPLHWAVEKGHVECVRVLCENGAKVDSRERWQNWTPLMVAASKGRVGEAA
eukprot:4657342-Prymnesium_polylepis.1